MTDQDCVRFLKWSLPQLQMRWNGFRKVRGQVCKRIDRRLSGLGLTDTEAYRFFLERNRAEWEVLDSLCRITISRFYRDREVFHALEREVLVRLCEDAGARGDTELRCWSVGCASGEEPYTIALLWDIGVSRLFPAMGISILGTDADRNVLDRAKEGCYAASSLRELPAGWKTAFVRERAGFCVRRGEREKVIFLEQDIRKTEPEGLFHLILCRNIVFTYFEAELQKEVLARMHGKLHVHGALVVGAHETLPCGGEGFVRWAGCPGVFRKE